MTKEHVRLTDEDRKALKELLQKSSLKLRTYKRVHALLELDKGQTYPAVVSIVQLSKVSLGKLARKYKETGLACIHEGSRPGRPITIQAEQRDQITLLACDDPPNGHGQWSLRLLADKSVELGYCERISHTHIKRILKKSKSNPT